MLPPTSIAAHAVDDVLETNEVEDLDVVGTATATIEKGSKHGFQGLPFLPPPPPVPPNAYTQVSFIGVLISFFFALLLVAALVQL